MRGTIVAMVASVLALIALVLVGATVPSEPMVSAASAAREPGADFAEALPSTGRVAGPDLPAGSHPPRPAVPSLDVRSAGIVAPMAVSVVAPVRLRIPAIGLDAPIDSVGVDRAGLLAVPDPERVGWYGHGPTPGGTGASVLAAHVDLGHVAGVFHRLDTAIAGDEVIVDFADGSSRTFEVVSDVLYDKTALPADELFRRDGPPVIHLITCGGAYDAAARHYLGNRVVTAVPSA
jgi:hypothetical protein